MDKLWKKLKRRFAKPHPYENLQMGLIKQYSLMIPKEQLGGWLERGWIEVPGFRHFHSAPRPNETFILGKPLTLLERGEKTLLGGRIVGYSTWYGTYGMGGPGFLGFEIEGEQKSKEQEENEVLVYAVWYAGAYTLIDNRVVECHPRYYRDYHPWVSQFVDKDVPNWDDLTPALLGSRIVKIELHDSKFLLEATKGEKVHQIEFLKNDARLPPLGGGGPRKDAFKSGVIGQYLVFQNKNAVLHI